MFLKFLIFLATYSLAYGQDWERAQYNASKIHPELLRAFEGRQLRRESVFVSMSQGDTFGVLNNLNFPDNATKAQRSEGVFNALNANAAMSQASTLNFLSSSGGAFDVEPFWISNEILVKNADSRLVAGLSMLPAVSGIRREERTYLIDHVITQEDLNLAMKQSRPEWGVSKMRAPQVWDEGHTGEGIRVCVIDTGTRPTHQALRESYVGAENNGWFDSTRNRRNVAYDDHGHGTHCTGSVLGANGMGVAPGAKWMACKGLGGSGGGGGDMNRCQQWTICPTKQDGSGRDCSKAPHIVSNSWGGGGNFERSIAAWRRADIIPIFAAGNSGTDCETMGYPGSSPSVIAVGATDANDRLASFSSVGPGRNGEEQKPEVSAPGVQVRSASHRSDTGLATMSGTSMACPHVAGLVALMMSKNPQLKFDEIKEALQTGVVTQGLRGPGEECGGKSDNEFPNYHFGYGRSDAPLTMQQI